MTAGQQHFFSHLEEHFENNLEENALYNWKKKAWDHFLELGLPSKKTEYFPRSIFKVMETSYERVIPKKIDLTPYIKEENYLVFVNGQFNESLSKTETLNEKIALMDLEKAMKSYGIFMQNRLAKTLKSELNPFAALNGALQQKGLFFYVPPQVQVEQRVQIISLITSGLIHPRMEFFLGEESSLEILETHVALSEKSFENRHVHVQLQKKANLKWYFSSENNSEMYHHHVLRAYLADFASFKGVFHQKSACFHFSDLQAELLGEEAFVDFKILNESEKADQGAFKILARHVAPSTRSSQLFKTILKDEAKAYFDGKIYVKPEAQKTEGYQMSRALLLSDEASCLFKPNLEIFADDVKASHGSTTWSLNEEDLFYLKSRGISEVKARELLIKAFREEILQAFPARGLYECKSN